MLNLVVVKPDSRRMEHGKALEWMPSQRLGGELPSEQADSLATMFRALGDANRLRLIYACLDNGACVQELANRCRLSPSLVSHNLRILKTLRLMRADRRGKRVFYTIDDDHIRDVLTDMVNHVAENPEHVARTGEPKITGASHA